MRKITHSSQFADLPAANVYAAIFAVGVMTTVSVSVDAGERERSSRASESTAVSRTSSVLEREFWTCDRAATTRGILGSEAYMCGSNFEELKKTRFDGDFAAMLAWWQRNKAAEHRALAEETARIATR